MHHHLLALTSLTVFCLTALTAVGQGTFQNMDFESADLGGYYPTYPLVPVEKGIPGWNAYFNNVPTHTIYYDNAAAIAAAISINDTNFPYGFAPLDGQYSVGLEGRPLGGGPASIGQTGLIPMNSLSVVFLLRDEQVGYFYVSFKGNVLPYSVIWSEPGFDICAADISSYAGQTGELRFTESYGGRAILDDIQFSTQAVPEPGTAALFTMGALAMSGRFLWRKKSVRS